MSSKKLDWKADQTLAVGKGATTQRFVATANGDDLEIDTEPWGEADLKVNGKSASHVSDDLDAGEAFRDLEAVAEEIEENKTHNQ